MRDLTRTLAMMVLSGVSTAAWALPWNVDMVDSDAVKAYEQEMRTLPQGVVAQPNALTPLGWRIFRVPVRGRKHVDAASAKLIADLKSAGFHPPS